MVSNEDHPTRKKNPMTKTNQPAKTIKTEDLGNGIQINWIVYT